MRLTFLTHFPGRGGSTTFLEQLRKFFEARGHSTETVCGGDAEIPVLDRYHLVPPVPHRRWRERRAAYIETVRRTAPDVVYAISGSEEFDVLRFLPLPRAHHIFSLEQHAWIDVPRLIRRTAHCTELFTANTPDVLEFIAARAAATRGALAPYRIGAEWFRSDPPAPADRVRVCFCGRLEPFQKRAHWLATIIPEARRRGLPLEWHIVGDGPSAAAIRLAAGADVHFHGWLPPGEIRTVHEQSDLFFLCSRWEGLPVAMVEAMAGGLAALVPRMPGGSACLLDAGGGWTYPAASPRAAVNALALACADRNRLAQQKREALRAAERFAPDAVDRQLLDLDATLRELTFNGRAEDPRTAAPARRVSPWRFLAQRMPLLLSRHAP